MREWGQWQRDVRRRDERSDRGCHPSGRSEARRMQPLSPQVQKHTRSKWSHEIAWRIL